MAYLSPHVATRPVEGRCGDARWSGFAAVGPLLLLSLLNAGASERPSDAIVPAELVRFERRQRHMGTEFVIQAYARDAATFSRATDAAFSEIERLDRTLSNYRSDSELSRLSASSPHDEWITVSVELWQVLRQADRISRSTSGAFDVTVGPYSMLWRRARRTQKWPDDARREAARTAVGFRHIDYDALTRAVRLTRKRMRLDLGGIAKGFALDQALQRLRQHGVHRALVDGGGDIVAGDAPPGQPGWRVGIAGLRGDETIDGDITLVNQAVATSGDLWQFVELDGVRYSHLVDPRTGVGLTQRSSVTVVGPCGMIADAWASGISVLGPEEGLAAAAQQDGLFARVVRRVNGAQRVDLSDGFPAVR